ncbi:putative ribonuclease H-like domain-containing protein [Tanacetum coccineum]
MVKNNSTNSQKRKVKQHGVGKELMKEHVLSVGRIIVPLGGLVVLIAKATTDESNLWHRRLGHVNFKNLNRLVKGNLVRGLPTKIFQNDHTCVACQKGKQHKASCKAKLVSSISHTLQLLHMDLFGPTSIRTKDETSAILKDFIRQIENQLNQKESRGNIAMPELHNKMELLRERTGPLLGCKNLAVQSHFYLTLFWGEQLVLLCYVLNSEAAKTSGTNIISTVSTTAKASGTNFVNTVSIPVGTASANEGLSLSNTTNSQEDDYEIPPLEIFMKMLLMVSFLHSSYDDEGAVADFTNLETIVNVSPIPTSRVHPSHPSTLILGDPTSAVQTRSKS